MPQHRRKEKLPQRIIDAVKSSAHSEFFGKTLMVEGARCNFLRPKVRGVKAKRGSPLDVQYSLKDGIISRTEFVRGEPSIPVHLAHFDPDSGVRFATVLDCY